jgi:hypothetical protein
VQHLIAPGALENVSDLFQRHIGTARAAQRESADLGNMAPAAHIEDGDDVENLVALVGLPDDIALICRTHQVEHLDRIEAPPFKVGFPQSDRELRQAGRQLDLNVGRPGDLAEHTGNVPCFLVEDIEIVAEQVDGDRSRIARQCLLDALGEERLDREVHPKETRERLADLGLGFFRFLAAQRFQIHLEFAVMGAPRIVSLLRPSHALGDGPDHGQLSQGVGDAPANPWPGSLLANTCSPGDPA